MGGAPLYPGGNVHIVSAVAGHLLESLFSVREVLLFGLLLFLAPGSAMPCTDSRFLLQNERD